MNDRPLSDRCLNCPPNTDHGERDHEGTDTDSTLCLRCWTDSDPDVSDNAYHKYRRYDE